MSSLAEVNVMDYSIATVLESVADAIPDAVAVVCGEQSHSWAELDERASRLAQFLSDRGVGQGSVVAIGMYNRPEHVEAILAVTKLGATPANLNYRYRESEIRHLLSDCAASAVIAEREVAARAVGIADELPSLAAVVTFDQLARQPPNVVSFATAVTDSEPAPRRMRSGDDGFIIYTGGTTGMPKATLWRQSRMLSRRWPAFQALGVDEPTSLGELQAAVTQLASRPRRAVMMPASPLIHATGLHSLLFGLITGALVVFSPSTSLDPPVIWRCVERHGVTTLAIVGDAFARPLLEELRTAEQSGSPYDVSTLEQITSSGVTWSADVKAGLLEFVDCRLIDVVASSEGGPYALSETVRGDVAPTSRFRLAPGARLIDEHGYDIQPGSGRIGMLAAPAAPDGYLGDASKTAETFLRLDGGRWSVPGDQAMLGGDGHLIFLGRGSSVINTGGEKVFAEEVENVLVSHPQVEDALVAPSPHERWGSIVVALVKSTTGEPLDEDALSMFVRDRLADYKRPRRYIFVPEVRRSPAGKADRKWATDLAADS